MFVLKLSGIKKHQLGYMKYGEIPNHNKLPYIISISAENLAPGDQDTKFLGASQNLGTTW